MLAVVFPGQGSQAVGMASALAELFPAARAVLDEVDAALGQDLSGLMREGPAETLNLTANAQPALMAASLAAIRVLETETAFRIGEAAMVAGHSLGEYSALAAAGSLALADAARLLRIRGAAMQRAVPVGTGAMAALLGLDLPVAEEVAREAATGGECCDVANDNGSGQVVVSGHKAAVERAVGIAQGRGARRAVLLSVSAPFHCRLMAPAAEAMREALAGVALASPAVPLVANVTAERESDPGRIRDNLVRQVTATVRWRESVGRMAELGCTRFVEVGAGKVLTGLGRRIAAGSRGAAFGAPADLEAVRTLLDRPPPLEA